LFRNRRSTRRHFPAGTISFTGPDRLGCSSHFCAVADERAHGTARNKHGVLKKA